MATGYLFHQAYKSTPSNLDFFPFLVALALGFLVCMIGTQNVATIMMLQGRFLLRDYLQHRAKRFKLFVALD
jgi:hypothetical protein